MSETTAEIRKLAHELIEGGIIAQAAERLVYQIVGVCAEHEREAVEDMRAKCEAIARDRLKVDPDCWTIIRDIAALKQSTPNPEIGMR